MPITPSFLTVTPTWASKRLTVDGSASVREAVTLRVVGCGTDPSVVFKISSENGRVDYAKFPNADTDAWTVDGDDLTATLNLNTTLLVAAFAPWGPEDRLDFIFTVASATNSNLYAVGHKQIGNWMEDTDDPVAYSTPLADAVEELDASLTALQNSFSTHAHDGSAGGAPRIPHGNLTDVGTNTHAAIDAALVTLSSGVSTNASNIAIQTGRIDAIAAAADTGTEIPAINANNDLVPMTEVYAAVRALVTFANSLKGGLA